MANISPAVDGWIAWDDRQASEAFSSEPARRRILLSAAREAGVDWILAIDPDERIEGRAATRLKFMALVPGPVAWRFALRELFEPGRYRIDGSWGDKTRRRFFPIHGGHCETVARHLAQSHALHDEWMPASFLTLQSGLELYHLKMISPARREARKNLYDQLDPERRLQSKGYAHLADEDGAQFRRIPQSRMYQPPHRDDGGLWMPDPAGLPPSS